jgi:hypothetical protein
MTSSPRAAAVFGRRACAVLAASSAVLHGVMIGHAGNPATAVLIVAMLATCLYCARDLWLSGSLRAWGLVAVMNLGMIVVHCSLPAHQHGAPVLGTNLAVAQPSTVMMLAITISAIEVAAATTVLYRHSRVRARNVII